jgi:hypothetical protein
LEKYEKLEKESTYWAEKSREVYNFFPVVSIEQMLILEIVPNQIKFKIETFIHELAQYFIVPDTIINTKKEKLQKIFKTRNIHEPEIFF